MEYYKLLYVKGVHYKKIKRYNYFFIYYICILGREDEGKEEKNVFYFQTFFSIFNNNFTQLFYYFCLY